MKTNIFSRETANIAAYMSHSNGFASYLLRELISSAHEEEGGEGEEGEKEEKDAQQFAREVKGFGNTFLQKVKRLMRISFYFLNIRNFNALMEGATVINHPRLRKRFAREFELIDTEHMNIFNTVLDVLDLENNCRKLKAYINNLPPRPEEGEAGRYAIVPIFSFFTAYLETMNEQKLTFARKEDGAGSGTSEDSKDESRENSALS